MASRASPSKMQSNNHGWHGISSIRIEISLVGEIGPGSESHGGQAGQDWRRLVIGSSHEAPIDPRLLVMVRHPFFVASLLTTSQDQGLPIDRRQNSTAECQTPFVDLSASRTTDMSSGAGNSRPTQLWSEAGCHVVHDQEHRRFQCTEDGCRSAFNRLWDFRRHIKSVHRRPTLRCPRKGCQKSFARTDRLREHVQKRHN